MSTKTMKTLNIVAGGLLVAAGIYCLCNQDIAVISAGVLLGAFMLAAGVAEIVVFAEAGRLLMGSGWLLLDGVLTVLMLLIAMTLSARAPMDMVWLTVKCLLWQGGLTILAIAAINVITTSRFDYRGSKRKK